LLTEKSVEQLAPEREVGSPIALGFTNREIGVRLGIVEETVKRHVSNVMLKLMVSRRTQIAIIAARGGWRDGWSEPVGSPLEELHGVLLEQERQGHPSIEFIGDWRDFFDSIFVLRADELEGQKVYVIRLKHGDLPPMTLYVDADTGDTLKIESIVITPLRIPMPITTSFEDFRETHGLRVPFRIVLTNDKIGSVVTQYESIEVEVDESIFDLSTS
jgi:hypothetical protein